MASFTPGALVGREFRIVRPLREGGMGEVYVAEQLSTGRLRALKVLSSQFEGDAGARERFEREARVGASIESDHVVEVVTAGVDEATGCAYLVMELLRGADLDDVLEARGPLPLADVAEIFSQVAHALDRAHELGVVHRDIKPANIFLSAPRRKGASFTAKVLDFGIAKAVAANRLTGTQPLGTPLYMAPEQMERASSVTGAADIWALGLVAFRLLTGRELWKAADESFAQLVKEVVVEPIPFATARAAELGAPGSLPPGFDAWFARAVCRDPAARFATAGELAQAFSELVPPGAPAGAVSDWLVEQIAARADSVVASAQLPQATGTDPTLMAASSASVDVPRSAAEPAGPVPGAPRPQEVTTQPTVATARAGGGASRVAVAVGLLAAIGGGVALVSRGAPSAAPSSAATMQPPAPPPLASSAAARPAPPACPEGMVHIAAGAMFMGDAELKNAGPPHRVTLRGFCLDRTEVTAAQYDACSAGGHCARAPRDVRFEGMTREQASALSEHCNSSRPERGSHPINCVDWHMADNFCRAKGGRLAEGGARLPTEAEWEFAARGAGQRTYPWGDEDPDPTRLNACGAECGAWFEAKQLPSRTLFEAADGFVGTAPVGSFPAGAASSGLLDLAGNVWEWTADFHGPYTRDEAADPTGPATGTDRVVRGGGWNGAMKAWAKPSYRWQTTPETYNHVIGFRCARDLAPGNAG